MTIKHMSCHTDASTANYYSPTYSTEVTSLCIDVRQQYLITPLFWGNSAHGQTMCIKLFIHNPQNVSRGEPRNEAKYCTCSNACTAVAGLLHSMFHLAWRSSLTEAWPEMPLHTCINNISVVAERSTQPYHCMHLVQPAPSQLQLHYT